MAGTPVAAPGGSIPANAMEYARRVVQYRRLRRSAKISLFHLARTFRVSVPAGHLTANDPPDALVDAAAAADANLGPPAQPLTPDERDAVRRILSAPTLDALMQLRAEIPSEVYEAHSVSAFEHDQRRLFIAGAEREAAYHHYLKETGKPLPPNVTVGTGDSHDPPFWDSQPGHNSWNDPVEEAGGIVNAQGQLECGAPQRGHGHEGEPCNCVLGDDLVCYYHP